MGALADALIKEGLVTPERLEEVKVKQAESKKSVEELLVEMGFFKGEDLEKLSYRFFEMPFSNLDKVSIDRIDRALTKLIPSDIATRYGVFPVSKKGNLLVLALSDPWDVVAVNDIRILTQMDIQPLLSTKSAISGHIEKYYQVAPITDLEENKQPDEISWEFLKETGDTEIDVIETDDKADRTFDVKIFKDDQVPAVKLVNLLLSDAVKARASDIHIEPQEHFCKARYRIDGSLKDVVEFPNKLLLPVVARIKVMAALDLAERRKPQDGRIKISAHNRVVDLRISVLPTYYGETVVIRLLDPKEAKVKLDELGLNKSELNLIKETATKPQGMFLITGPTGSGKTSTLYAILNFIKSETTNIITIEDPIEYLIDGINQIQLNPIKNVTFATALRSILRQDPNVILIGEIRDKETADIALRSSLTGHLVFSTLHTNTAIASVSRLLDIGVEAYLIATSLILIVAQRLIRVICPHCKEEYTPDKKIINKFKLYISKLNITTFYRGKGCEQCSFSGFLGRTAVFEILEVKHKIRTLISNNASEDEILEQARKDGLKLLFESGIEKIVQGITTLEELASVADLVEGDTASANLRPTREKPMILVADDDADILKGLEIRLKSVGYEVITAKNGKELVEYAGKEMPDLIVTDVMMPEMDGFEATKILRSNLETAPIPILMLTGKGDTKSELEGLDIGADDYVSKPFDTNILLARIKTLLKRRT